MSGWPWEYYVPFQPDAGAALRDLQHEVFTRGAFHKPIAEIDFLDEIDFFTATDAAREQMLSAYGLSPLREIIARVGIEGLRQWLTALSVGATVETREELAALSCLSADGTRSVLDMQGIADRPAAGFVTPLPTQEVVRLYGTERPTRAMVDADRAFFDGIGRGEGVYFTVFTGDDPDAVFFGGCSYD
jgi:hypothetical protein